ncbi:unnamed protein product [Camellia sinensis]
MTYGYITLIHTPLLFSQMNEIESGRVEFKVTLTSRRSGGRSSRRRVRPRRRVRVTLWRFNSSFSRGKILDAEGYVLKLADVIPGEVESISGRCLALLTAFGKKETYLQQKTALHLQDRCGTLTGSRKDEKKVSRQEYLKKMEQKKLKELRDDIKDEQYLFDGVKLIEYGELSSHRRGAVAAVVCSLVLVLIKRCYCYCIVAATDDKRELVEVPVVESGGRKTIGNMSIRDVQFLLIAPEIYKNYRGEALQDERINGGAFIGTDDSYSFPSRKIATKEAISLKATSLE